MLLYLDYLEKDTCQRKKMMSILSHCYFESLLLIENISLTDMVFSAASAHGSDQVNNHDAPHSHLYTYTWGHERCSSFWILIYGAGRSYISSPIGLSLNEVNIQRETKLQKEK